MAGWIALAIHVELLRQSRLKLCAMPGYFFLRLKGFMLETYMQMAKLRVQAHW